MRNRSPKMLILAALTVNILIACLLVGCANHYPVTVRDESLRSMNRPAVHRVMPGDTLFSIAWRYGLKYEELAKYNGISPPYLIKPSQIIRLDMRLAPSGISTSARQKSTFVRQGKLPSKKNNIARSKNQSGNTVATRTPGALPNAPVWSWPSRGILLVAFQAGNGLNKGIDIGGKLGEPVLAAASGQVVYAGNGLRGYGRLLIIKHNESYLSAYAHNDRLLVKEGDLVKVGQRIADMGSSGTDRVKLHFEIRRDGTPVDPLKYLPRR